VNTKQHNAAYTYDDNRQTEGDSDDDWVRHISAEHEQRHCFSTRRLGQSDEAITANERNTANRKYVA